MISREEIVSILDLARWAPSGDNEQNWRFEIQSNGTLSVHGYDTREICWLDKNGRASHIALGCLLENIVLSGEARGYLAKYLLRPQQPETHPILDITFVLDNSLEASTLAPFIEKRVTNRFPYSPKKLSPEAKRDLLLSGTEDFEIILKEDAKVKWKGASLNMLAAKFRYEMPMAYKEMERILDWEHQFSTDRIPSKAIGADPFSLLIAKWLFKTKERFEFFTRFPGGTAMTRFSLDMLPFVFCGAHFYIFSKKPLKSAEQAIEGGRVVQRLWLEAAKNQLYLQPAYTPVIISQLHESQKWDLQDPYFEKLKKKVHDKLSQCIAPYSANQLLFFGRLGYGSAPKSRSIRKDLADLMYDPN